MRSLLAQAAWADCINFRSSRRSAALRLAPCRAVHTHGNDDATAWSHTLQVAEQKTDPDAMYRAGLAFSRGEGGPSKDVKAAKAWLREAAEMGHPRAQSKLGCILYDEMEELRSLSQVMDYQAADEAQKWLMRAHVQGDIDATRRLIPLYVTRANLGAAILTMAAWVRRRLTGL